MMIDPYDVLESLNEIVPGYIADFIEGVGILDSIENDGINISDDRVEIIPLSQLKNGGFELFHHGSIYTYYDYISYLKNEGLFKSYDNLKAEVVKALEKIEKIMND